MAEDTNAGPVKIVPTVGRILHYYSREHQDGDHPLPAIITRVWGENCVNLAIFSARGSPFTNPPTSIPLVQQGQEPPTGSGVGYCRWVPFQVSAAQLSNVDPLRVLKSAQKAASDSADDDAEDDEDDEHATQLEQVTATPGPVPSEGLAAFDAAIPAPWGDDEAGAGAAALPPTSAPAPASKFDGI